jgi:hypothetical protein
VLAIVIWVLQISQAAGAQSVAVSLGAAAVELNGPWKFKTGDDLGWADPNFSDTTWETVDLTPLPGAHDGDQGLTHYTAGWSARGHAGYSGFAWYRMNVRVSDTGAVVLWLAGPALVDNAYQLYINGHLLGGIGDFSHSPPRVYGLQPRLFALPRDLWVATGRELSAVIAFRVASLEGLASPTDGGGIHIAPVFGTEAGVRDHYRLQWLEKAEAFAVDATEPVFFLLLALLALAMIPFDRRDSFNLWIAAVATLLAATWFNQPLFWMGHFETLQDFLLWRLTIVDGLLLGAWIMAWRAAFGLQDLRWIGYACAGLTVAYLLARPLSTALLVPDFPPTLISVFAEGVRLIRLGFLLLLLLVMWLGYSHRGRWLLLLTILTGSISVFARELGQLRIPGIWFPWGVGLSRSECANAAFAVLLFLYLIHRLWHFANGGIQQPHAKGERSVGDRRSTSGLRMSAGHKDSGT